MILPPGGFIVLGSWLLLINYIQQRRTENLIGDDLSSHEALELGVKHES